MHRAIKWVCLPVGVFAIACGKSGQTTANSDLQRDLKLAATANLDLASQSQSTKYALVETAPDSKQTEARSLKKNPGPKAIRSKTPTVKASADSEAAAMANLPQLQMMSSTPPQTTIVAVMPTNPLPIATSALPAPVQTRGAGTEEGTGSGSGSGMRPGIGIHGMGPDGDNCGPPRPGMGGGGFPPIMIPMVVPGGASSAGHGSSGAAPRAHGGRGM